MGDTKWNGFTLELTPFDFILYFVDNELFQVLTIFIGSWKILEPQDSNLS